jgi:hypothetical protein
MLPRDRRKIVIDSENQVRIWTRHFGVTQEELARAIETVGNSAAAVRKQLDPGQPPVEVENCRSKVEGHSQVSNRCRRRASKH